MRIDNAIYNPGFYRKPRCYTLIVNNEELKILHVSRGWRVNPKNQTHINTATAHFKEAARQANADLSGSTVARYLKLKNSSTIPLINLSSELSARRDGTPVLKLRSGKLKYLLILDGTDLETARQFTDRLKGN